MKSTNVLMLAPVALIICACAPLQQAPLLYSSKTTVGVDLSASTTETPGASISLGVKLVDAAYVPVAVSKDSQLNRSGEIKAFDILRIEAIYGEGVTGSKLDSLTDENKEKIKKYLSAKNEEDSAKNEFDRVVEDLNTIQSSPQNVGEAVSGAPPNDGFPTNNIDGAPKRPKENQEQINALKARRERSENNWKAKKEKADALFSAAAEAASLLRTDKHDAMSVYGRFDSKGDGAAGSSPSASLTVGKIFSTGVASQNLTEAVKNDSRYSATAHCLDGIKTLVDKLSEQAKKDELIGKIYNLCKQSDVAR